MATAAKRRSATRSATRKARQCSHTDVRLWSELFARHDLLTCASAIAFRSFVALVPLALLAVAVLGLVGEQRLWNEQIGPAIQPRLLPQVYAGTNATVQKIFSGDGALLLGFALVLTLWDVSSGLRSVMGAFCHVYEQEERRSTVRRFAVSLAIAVPFVAAMVGSVLLVFLLPRAAQGVVGVALQVVAWGGALVVQAFALWLLLRFGPPEARRVRWVSVGAGLVVLGWAVQSVLFRIFVVDVANFRSPVGTLAVFLVLTTYLYVAAIVLLVGIELDELLREGEGPRPFWQVAAALRSR